MAGCAYASEHETMTTTNRNALLETPDVPWASDAIELVFTQESRSVANHSARSWIFARMLRDHLNLTQTRAIRFASKSTEQIVPLNFLPPRVSTPPRSIRCGRP